MFVIKCLNALVLGSVLAAMIWCGVLDSLYQKGPVEWLNKAQANLLGFYFPAFSYGAILVAALLVAVPLLVFMHLIGRAVKPRDPSGV